jgi:hypothetical protein
MGKFQPGHKKSPNSGMKKGQVCRDRQALLDKAKELGVDVFEILLRFAAGDWKGLGYETDGQTVNTAGGGSYWQYWISPETRQKSAADASQYILPKLKAVELSMDEDSRGPITVTLNLSGHASKSDPAKPDGSDKPSEKTP